MRMIRSFVLVVSMLIVAINVCASPGDENWESMGGYSGTDGYVYATATYGNKIYIAGNFTIAGKVSTSNIISWDGSSWMALGTGIGPKNVFTMTIDQNGNLYAAGLFGEAGGIPVNNIARWNGSSWIALGSGLTGCDGKFNKCVTSLKCDSDGNLYAVGSFNSAGGITAKYIAKWDGTNWSGIGAGLAWDGCTSSACIDTLEIDANNNIYVGGTFTTADGVSANNIAKWNGVNWTQLAAGIGGVNANVSSMQLDQVGNLYVAGYFTTAGDISAKSIAMWDGTAWSSLGAGLTGNIYSIRALILDNDGSLIVGGNFKNAGVFPVNGIAKWNGTTWATYGSGLIGGGNIYSLAINGDGKLFAGGSFSGIGTVSTNNIAMWNGNEWQAIEIVANPNTLEPSDIYTPLTAVDQLNNLYVTGRYQNINGNNTSRIAKWDGSTWSTLGTGMNGSINAIAVDGQGNLYAGGGFTNVDGMSAKGIAKWNGIAWESLAGGIGGGSLPSVKSLVVDANNNVYVGGTFKTAGGLTVNNIARWNGSSWSGLGSGMSYGGNVIHANVTAMKVDNASNLYVSGQFDVVNGLSISAIAKWNGSSWEGLPPLLVNEKVERLLGISSDQKIYVSAEVASQSKHLIKAWSGSSWELIGEVDCGTKSPIINTLVFDNQGTVYIGGDFCTVNGVAMPKMAKWNNSEWSRLGSDLLAKYRNPIDSSVYSLSVDVDGNVIVGGVFAYSADQVTLGLSKWLVIDTDGDHWQDYEDVYPTDPTEWKDSDGDGIANNSDNCQTLANADQSNTDGDAEGDFCDSDDDNDGVLDIYDFYPSDDSLTGDYSGKEGELLGTSVAIAEMDNDGYADIIIGSPLADVMNGTVLIKDAGTIKIISGDDGSVINSFNGTFAKQQFGAVIAVVTDQSNPLDGIPDLVVGNPFTLNGNVSLYSGADGSLIQSIADGALMGDKFGAAITVDQGGNLVVGAPLFDVPGIKPVKDAGRVYVFNGISNTVLYTRDGMQAGEHFGSAVAVNRLDEQLLIGSPGFDVLSLTKVTDAGKVQIFYSADLTGTSDAIVIKQGAIKGDMFGSALCSFNQDIDGDTKVDWSVGIPGADIFNNTTNKLIKDAGSVQIFSGLNLTAIKYLEGETKGDYFGAALGSGADINNDGIYDIAIGTPRFDALNVVNNKILFLKDSGKVKVLSAAEFF